MAALWPLYLGVAAAHSGLGITSYGPFLVLGVAMFSVGAICHRCNRRHNSN